MDIMKALKMGSEAQLPSVGGLQNRCKVPDSFAFFLYSGRERQCVVRLCLCQWLKPCSYRLFTVSDLLRTNTFSLRHGWFCKRDLTLYNTICSTPLPFTALSLIDGNAFLEDYV